MRIVLWIFAFCLLFNQPATAQETTETNLPINLQQAWQRADEYSTELRSQRIDPRLDLIFTREPDIIEKINYKSPIGVIMIEFKTFWILFSSPLH